MLTTILSGKDKGKSINVAPISIDVAKLLRPGTTILVYTGYSGRNRLNGVIHCKVNGKPKTWKTRPDDVNVPVKYGLYEYTTIEYRNGVMVDENLYIVGEK